MGDGALTVLAMRIGSTEPDLEERDLAGFNCSLREDKTRDNLSKLGLPYQQKGSRPFRMSAPVQEQQTGSAEKVRENRAS